MSRVDVNISAPNLAAVCIDQVFEGAYIGRVFHKYSKTGIGFNTLEQLLKLLDRLYDQIGYPQSTTLNRNFQAKQTIKVREEALQVMDSNTVLEQKGAMGTFVVHVKYRQNSTWQGEVVWAEKNEKRSFRSALELLKLIDGALDDEEE